ncbi:MAG: hypothetical protein OJJ21_16830 [Ferrovibrio sp.]|uniref:hypothetical protein n=1 Tax=Ferrovibrio sp. TaxID=1917215 RepID=UPI00262D874D|nr:hypothetical protein [Ferrovibrio sp.]MCW0235266.1 hypothetical protein [Ferrovibrio sp.]
MARPRLPIAKAKALGSDVKKKSRFEGRNEPIVNDDLGPAFDWLTDTDGSKQRQAWATIRKEVPWLNSSHRILVAEASVVLGRMIAGQEVGIQAMNLLRQCLGQMGATPADASKAGAKPNEDEKEPGEEFFE